MLTLHGMRPLIIESGFDVCPRSIIAYYAGCDNNDPPRVPPYWANSDWDPAKWGTQPRAAIEHPGIDAERQFFFYVPHDGHADLTDGGAAMSKYIEGVKTMFGVQKVNIMAHSMGGLWSRAYVLDAGGAKNVDHLLMLGTPNAGSAIADGLLWNYVACSPNWGNSQSEICRHFVEDYHAHAPAILQPTNWYMDRYNQNHGVAPCVTYVDQAAQARFHNWFGEDTWNSDQVVTVASVQALQYTNTTSRHLPSIVEDWDNPNPNDFLHNQLPKRPLYQDALRPYYSTNHNNYTCPSIVTAPRRPTENMVPTAHWAEAAGSLTTGQTLDTAVPLDTMDAATFSLHSGIPAAELALTLRDPVGTIITPTTVYTSAIYNSANTTYTIAQPMPGTWHVVVTAPSVLTNPAEFFMDGAFTGGVQLSPVLNSATVRVGAPVDLNVTLQDSLPIHGAVVTATIVLIPDAIYTGTLVLNEQPNGIYGRPFTPPTTGQYLINFHATGTNTAGQAFTRGTMLMLSASDGAALTGTFTEAPTPAAGGNSSGGYTGLTISATTVITQPGPYRLSGWLTSAAGDPMAYATGIYTAATGTQVLPLHFTGDEIGKRGIDGPYQLRNLYFAQVLTDEITIASLPVAYTTAAYSRYDWSRDNALPAGQATTTAVDTNANGLFDYLQIQLPLDIRDAATYSVTMNLLDGTGGLIATSVMTNANFIQGANTLTFRFAGPVSRASGSAGPYHLANLVIARDGQRFSDLAAITVQTPPYSNRDFDMEPCPVVFADVPPADGFYAAIRCLACQGVMHGYSCGSTNAEPCNNSNDPYFRPSAPLTRGQAAQIVVRSANFTEPISPTQQTFADVLPNATFWREIEQLAGRSIVGGYTCGGVGEPCDSQNRPYYRPYNPVSRNQLAHITVGAAGFTDPIPPSQQTFESANICRRTAGRAVLVGY